MTEAPTRAARFLASRGVPFELHRYQVTCEQPTYGESVAATLGIPPARLFKTLVAQVDGDPCVALVPCDRRLDPKALARAAGGRRARLATPAAAKRLTGYDIGGISPFAHRKLAPFFIDASVNDHQTVFVSGGLRGLQLELAPRDLVRLLGAERVELLGTREPAT